uniref:O-antigen polymerase n=1 Tax=Aeromonas hydrophila TaxID=644 RepID=A0A346ACJ8_AERHY|nr:hypothetical protein [Aeromonas hydrophila]
MMTIGSAIQLGSYSGERFFIPLITAYCGAFAVVFFKIKVSKSYFNYAIVNFVCYMLLLLSVSLGTPNESELIFDCVKITLPFIYALVIPVFIYNMTRYELRFVINSLSLVVLTILAIELFIRSGTVSSIADIERNFYLFKMHSPFFFDSNALALYIMLYLVIFFYYNYIYLENTSIYIGLVVFLLFIFVLLTFSRSAIIGTMSLFFVYKYVASSRFTRLCLFASIVFCFFLFIPYVVDLVHTDGSGSTKLSVWSNLPNIMDSYSSYNLLWGFGINDGNFAYSYEPGEYSHVLIPMLLGQVGLIGMIVYVSYFFIVLSHIGKNYLLLIIPVFLVGLSYLHPFLETIFFASAFLYGMHIKSAAKSQ